jgi:hypothetical protein
VPFAVSVNEQSSRACDNNVAKCREDSLQRLRNPR